MFGFVLRSISFLVYMFNVHRYKRTQLPIWHKYGNFPNCLLVTHKAKIVSSEPEHKHYKIYRYSNMYWNISKYVNIYQNVSLMHQNVSECMETYQNVQKMHQNVWISIKYIKFSQNMTKLSKKSKTAKQGYINKVTEPPYKVCGQKNTISGILYT